VRKIILLVVLGSLLLTSYAISVEIFCTFDARDPNFDASVSFTSPSPANESWNELTQKDLSLHVSNELGQTMNVSFHWANHSLIAYNDSVTNDTTVTVTFTGNYNRYQQYNWYANVSSVSFDNQSEIYWFKAEAFDWDINRDAYVNMLDINAVRNNYLQTTSNRNDVTGDGVVNYLDRSRLQHHWGDDYN